MVPCGGLRLGIRIGPEARAFLLRQEGAIFMAYSVCGSFATRREAELAVEHLVQDHHLNRKSVTIQPAGAQNTAGKEAAGADVESGHPGLEKHGDPKLGGAIEVRVACSEGERQMVEAVLREAGGERLRAG